MQYEYLYIKYKKKYLALKQQLRGGVISDKKKLYTDITSLITDAHMREIDVRDTHSFLIKAIKIYQSPSANIALTNWYKENKFLQDFITKSISTDLNDFLTDLNDFLTELSHYIITKDMVSYELVKGDNTIATCKARYIDDDKFYNIIA